jgi:hypothetical protein
MICFFQFSVWLRHLNITPRIQTLGQKGDGQTEKDSKKPVAGKGVLGWLFQGLVREN